MAFSTGLLHMRNISQARDELYPILVDPKGAVVMLTAEGCRRRRERLWAKLDPPPESDYLLLSDPIHLVYFANYWVDPISLGAGFPGYLMIRKDGHAKLLHENRAPQSAKLAHVEE